MQVADRELVVLLDQGLHARPAARFVETAAKFKSNITVTCGARSASAKSILGVLGLGARKGSTIRIHAEGPDAEAAVEALSILVCKTHVD